MRARLFLLLSGAAGLVLAALICLVAWRVQGALSFFVLLSSASFVILLLLIFVSLFDIAVMTLALRKLAPAVPPQMLHLIAASYVAFAAVYALLYALLVPDAQGILFLAALAIVRWFTLLLVSPVSQTK